MFIELNKNGIIDREIQKMKYCMECGTKLIKKYLKNEGDIPYCESCKDFRFPVFSTAVSMIVMNKSKDKILLINQYGKKDYILVAGYVNKGENAESAVIREVAEETGLNVIEYEFNQSEYFEKSNTLMINFMCRVEDENLDGITEEVDKAVWFTKDEALKYIKDNSLAEKFLKHYLKIEN